jgi:transcriptional regulator with PAS, ATPase and Fis domain
LRAQIERKSTLPDIIGDSKAMTEAVRLVERVAPSDASVLITGESGTGKELIAQAIHRLSNRAGGSFIDLNCAAFQESLLESELFGYEAGAFSGAKARKLGLIELADGGTLFLDEVTELPSALQAKLLRAIETRTFFRVGGVRKVEVNVRIVAATNRNLDTVINNGSFRADLLYRINSFEIHLSPLRERPEDINPLTQYILKQLAGSNVPEVAPEVMEKLREYNWPGNVRQLRNCLERAVLLANDGRVTINELPPEVAGHVNGGMPMPVMSGVTSPESGVQPTALRDVEKQQIIAALEQTGWHRGKTAALLGISPSTLYRRLRDYNLEGRLR